MDDNRMGFWACMAYVVGNVVGSGIFITPTDVLRHAGSVGLAIVIWLLCGFISLLGGVAFIELGTGIPSDGGDFAYATYVGWNAVAFAFMAVGALLTFPASTAVQCSTFGFYLVEGIKQAVEIDSTWSVWLQYLFSLALLVGCSFMNGFSVGRIAGVFQMFATAAKTIILAMVIVIGAYWVIFKETTVTVENAFEGSDYSVSSVVMSCYMGLWSFAGWDILNYGAPAVKNPRRTLPLALIGGLILVTLLYAATNFSFAAVLSKDVMLNSTAVAADFAKMSMGPFAAFIPFATAVLLIGSVNANIFCTSRIILEAAKEGHLFGFLAAQNQEHSSPRAALLFQFIVAALFTFLNVETLINYVSFVIFAQKAVTMGALFVIRRKKLEMHPDVLRVPLPISAIFFAFCLILVAIPVFTQFWMTFFGAIGVLCCMFLYYLFVVKQFRVPGYDQFHDGVLRMMKHVLGAELDVDSPNDAPAEPVDNNNQNNEEDAPAKQGLLVTNL